MVSPRSSGIDFENRIVETDSMNAANYEYLYNGAGAGIADLNNDGLPDIVFAGNQVSSRVYLNLGNFKFRDITKNFPGLSNDQWYSGVAIADINSDGWPDVYLTSTANRNPEKCKNRLWINNGAENGKDPIFTEMAESYGIADMHQSVAAGFFDYDRDGDLDLYVLNNTLNKRMDAFYRPKINDGSAANNDRLYRNNGNGTFTDVTVPAGIVCEGFGLGMAFSDLNNDGYPDVIVSGNDYSWDVSTGYFDALKGYVLISRGKSQLFEILPPSKSGLLLQGMAGALLFLEGDTSLVVAGMNRSKALTFKQIKKPL